MELAKERKQEGSMMETQWKQSNTRSQKSPAKCQNLVMEAIAKLKGEKIVSEVEKGVVRMKIVVKKEDLKKMLKEVSGGLSDDKKRSSLHLSNSFDNASFTLEQRLIIMRKQQSRKANEENCQGPWKPILQSIPEEL